MRRHHRHLLRAVLLAVAATAAWWYLTGPASVLTADWEALGWALLAAELGAWLAVRAALFFTGPAWWAALATNDQRARWRHWRKGHGHGRPHIPDRLRRWVYRADGWACVYCGYVEHSLCSCGKTHSNQFEHGRPFSRGGKTSLANGLTLCPHCNLAKSDAWVYPGGRVYYHGFSGHDDAAGLAAALDILRVGKQARRSPARLARLMVACLAG